MKEVKISIDILSSKEKVWNILWDDKSFRDWASLIDEGTYIKGILKEGNKVEFISEINGYGVTSLVEKLVPFEYILFKHNSDTKDSGVEERDNEWTGGRESYTLVEKNGITTLTIQTEIPDELLEIFNERLPLTISRIKELAEVKE